MRENNEVVAECVDVWRLFGHGEAEVQALAGLNLAIESGEFVGIAGPSGSGKSTLLNLFGALDLPGKGEVFIEGVPLSILGKTERAQLRLQKIGFVFQAYNLIPVLSARENVEFIMQLQGVASAERRRRALAMLAELELEELADRRPGDMSGGQQQRVAVARAMVTRPPLLLADEPSANLDTGATDGLMELMVWLNAEFGTTIVTVSHDHQVLGYAKRQLQLRDGKIVGDEARS